MRLSLETQKDIYQAYLANPNKVKIASEFGTSARTVGRIVEKGRKGDYDEELEVPEVGGVDELMDELAMVIFGKDYSEVIDKILQGDSTEEDLEELTEDEPEVAEDFQFQVGDIVTAVGHHNPYSITTGNFTGEVLEVGDNPDHLTIKVLTLASGEDRWFPEELDEEFSVNAMYFKLLSRPTASFESFEPELEEADECFEVDGKRYVRSAKALEDMEVGDLVYATATELGGQVGRIINVYTCNGDYEPDVDFDGDTHFVELEGDREGYLVELVEDSTEEAVTIELGQPKATFMSTGGALMLQIEGEEPLLIDTTHVGFTEATQACIDGDFLRAAQLMDVETAITTFSEGAIEVDAEACTLTYKGMQVHNALVDKILSMMSSGNDEFKRLVRFFEKTQSNPAPDARRQLMLFAAASDLQIDEDGNVLAFKNVKDDFKPKWVGMYDDNGNYQANEYYDNSVGATCKMPRELVDDNINNTCSHGLHVCSVHYLKSFWGTNGRTMKVAVNPVNFVAIPTDYNNSKARVCEYTVVEDVTDNLSDYL